MIALSIYEIATACGGKIICGGNTDYKINSVTTDSRRIENDLFIALKGENFDGNDYALDFLEKGGKCVVVQKEIEAFDDKTVILVESTAKAILDISACCRSKFDGFVAGVTGSVGKTSTKDMIASVLSARFNTLKTSGNKNNEIGVPLTLFELCENHETAVVEMGMNNFGEISRLSRTAKPSVAVITNIGTAHIGNLGSREGILKAKLEIKDGLSDDGILILNGDDEYLYGIKDKTADKSIMYFAVENKDADVFAYNIVSDKEGSSFDVDIYGKKTSFKINVAGIHHIYNALAAVCCGIVLKESEEDMVKGASEYKNDGLRQKEIKAGGVTVIEDCYNASSVSMKASLNVLRQIADGNRTIAVLGDILEQGSYAEEMHREVGKSAVETSVDIIVAVGNDAFYIKDEAEKCGHKNSFYFKEKSEALEFLKNNVKCKDTVSFKGSRGMKLEEIADALAEFLRASEE